MNNPSILGWFILGVIIFAAIVAIVITSKENLMKDKYERVGWILGVLLFLGLMGWLVALTSVQESLNRRLKAVQWQVDSICRLPDMIWMTRRDSMIAADTLPAVKP